MNSVTAKVSPTVTIVGGGLAGLAAAVGLASAGCQVELFESRRSLGGRAASFRDPTSGELVDHCLHVSMGCCTNLADFCRRTGIAEFFRHDRVLHFIAPDQKQYRMAATSWLPAPLHLVPAFLSLGYLSIGERFRIARAMWKLMRDPLADDAKGSTAGQWLREHGQSPNAIERFWSVVLVSALGEELDRASMSAARKVLVDGFLAARDAYVVEIPETPLGTLYGERLEGWLLARGVKLRLNAPIRQVTWDGMPVVVQPDGQELRSDFVVIAVPWSKITDIVSAEIADQWPWLDEMRSLDAAPITGIHLWFDRKIMSLPHAVLVGRLSQWIFARPTEAPAEHYYQVVISASRGLAGRNRDEIACEVHRELSAIWPEARAARLLRARVVTEHGAVFSVRPGLDLLRPAQETSLPGVVLAGDWTSTGWPATMEGAVRSGYLAAESVLRSVGRDEHILMPDLSRGLLARLLIKTRSERVTSNR